MEKRLVLALALSILVILGLQYFTVKPKPPQEVPQAAGPSAVVSGVSSIQAEKPMAEPAVSEEEYVVETERYSITFSNIGGAIKSISLKDFTGYRSAEPLILSSTKNPNDYIFNTAVTTIPGSGLAGYALSKEGGAIVYKLTTGGWTITKRYTVNNTLRGIELQILINNGTGAQAPFAYRVVGGSGMSEASDADRRFIEVRSSIDGKILGYKNPKDARIVNVGAVKWTALKSKYFSLILKPLVATKDQFYYIDRNGMLVTGVDVTDNAVPAGATIENAFRLYVGPIDIATLKRFDQDLEETIDYGFFGGISKALLAVLRFCYSLVHSWGLAIIMLSVLLNILLFPLTLKSFSSMQKMQALQPQMEKLKKLHKDNPQKLNKDIMELYKKYKINPLSGCLPMLLQMPIFIALYQALMRSIELRNAKFLWIDDLSSPDAVRIPITLPILGNSINILPLIMVAAMVIQQKMSSRSMGGAVTDEQKQQQKMMLIMMPIMFGFIFYNMPSGLVMYWIINTVLTIIEQRASLKNIEVEE